MKIKSICPNNWLTEIEPALRTLGYQFTRFGEVRFKGRKFDAGILPPAKPDLIICWSISQLKWLSPYLRKYPSIPLINYNWDLYSWQFQYRDGKEKLDNYDWETYGEILARSIDVWNPSICTLERMKDFYELTNGTVIKTFVPVDHLEKVPIKDGRYVLNALRRIPDKNLDWFEKACEELNIPYVSTGAMKYSKEEYKKILAECSFIVSPWREASTGGLSLVEGTYLGKPCLISDSPYLGARDYMGDRAHYFKHDSYEDLKSKIKELWNHTPKLDLEECRTFVRKEYAVEVMAQKIKERLAHLGFNV